MLSIKSKLTNYFKKKTCINIHLTVNLEDLDDDKTIELIQSVGDYGYFTFTPDKLKTRVEKIMRNKTIGIRQSGFSPSQVLRGKINILWEKSDSDKTFAEFYTYWMETIISHFEKKIQEHKN